MFEIHKSKLSYCEYDNDDHGWYDYIVSHVLDYEKGSEPYSPQTEEMTDAALSKLTWDVIDEARTRRAARIADLAYRAALRDPERTDKVKLSEFKFDPSTIPIEDLVFRVYTYDHIPLEPGRKKNPKDLHDFYVKLNFIPFKHYRIDTDELSQTYGALRGQMPLVEVLRSHTKDGEFSMTHGSFTDELAKMLMKMVERYSQKANWRGYTYLDEMQGQALLQLSHMALQFNEAKSDNPFSYYTATMTNSFRRILIMEKANQNIRDDLLIDAGQNPSFTRQLAIEEEIRKMRESAQEE